MKDSIISSVQDNLKDVRFVIAVAAGKGGVGKSSATVNLALVLKKQGFDVGIIDADVYGPSIRKMLPEEVLPFQDPSQSERIVPAMAFGIKVVSMAYFRQENEAAIVRAPIANSVIAQFLLNVNWGTLDYLLIDFPPGTGDIQLTLMQQARLSGAVIITTPQEIALIDVRKAVQMFEQLQIPLIGVVENMSYFCDPVTQFRYYPFGQGGGHRLAQEFGIPFLGEIPLDPKICASGDEGRSIFNEEPHSIGVKIFTDLAEQIQYQLYALEKHEGNYLKHFELKWEKKPNANE